MDVLSIATWTSMASVSFSSLHTSGLPTLLSLLDFYFIILHKNLITHVTNDHLFWTKHQKVYPLPHTTRNFSFRHGSWHFQFKNSALMAEVTDFPMTVGNEACVMVPIFQGPLLSPQESWELEDLIHQDTVLEHLTISYRSFSSK